MANWATTGLLGYPSTPYWQRDNLVWIEPVPGQRWQVYKQAAPAFEGFFKDLVATGYQPTSSGGFNYRNKRGGSSLSQHAFGTAIDLNAADNPMLGKGAAVKTNLPANVGEIAAKHGLEWGGNWKSPDAMHFEYTGAGFKPDPYANMPDGPKGQEVYAPQPDTTMVASTGPTDPGMVDPALLRDKKDGKGWGGFFDALAQYPDAQPARMGPMGDARQSGGGLLELLGAGGNPYAAFARKQRGILG